MGTSSATMIATGRSKSAWALDDCCRQEQWLQSALGGHCNYCCQAAYFSIYISRELAMTDDSMKEALLLVSI